jgi:hypothetical protein
MSWFKKKRSLRISPIPLADLAYQIQVEEDNPQAAPERYHLPETVHERFRQKVFLYREANVLLALWIWAKQDPGFEQPPPCSAIRPRCHLPLGEDTARPPY